MYLSMALKSDSMNLPGFYKYFKAQSEEEREHAVQFLTFINQCGGEAKLLDQAAPSLDTWSSVGDMATAALQTEMEVSESIKSCMDVAQMQRRYGVTQFLSNFALNQIEEEDNAQTLCEQVVDYDHVRGLIHHLDKIIGKKAGK